MKSVKLLIYDATDYLESLDTFSAPTLSEAVALAVEEGSLTGKAYLVIENDKANLKLHWVSQAFHLLR